MRQTKMSALRSALARTLRLLALPLVVLALTACGPGTGGTGTGPISGIFQFSGPGFSSGMPCAGQCPSYILRLEPEHVEYSAGCNRFTATGPWAIDDKGMATLPGTLETTESVNGQVQTRRTPAWLYLQFGDAGVDSTEVSLSVRDAAGANLLMPTTLHKGTEGAQPAACTAGR